MNFFRRLFGSSPAPPVKPEFDSSVAQRLAAAGKDPARMEATPAELLEMPAKPALPGFKGMVRLELTIDAGGKVVVMPHADVAVIREAKGLGMVCIPGVATPTEAFAALAAGADGLKMFPAEALPPGALKAWRAVLPRDALVFAVGGIRPDNMAPYWSAGASGFGTGSNLYAPGAPAAKVREAAAAYASGFRALPVR